ncbi:MAG: prolyl oligopeptidase family serine peptidase [Limisphaerales bacterium]
MMTTRLGYPETVKQDVVDDYHGTKVPDPYRWLEDDNAAETKAWVVAQNKVTYHYLDQIPERARLKERLTKLWNFERYGIPFKQGGRYFYSKNDGLQNQSVLYVADSLEATPRVLLDPNKLSSDGTVALSGYRISEDGNLMAYGLAASGSDWNEWKVRDVRTGADVSDHLKWVKFSGASWTKDGKGFFYSRYDAPKEGDALKGVNKFQKLYYHRIGTAQGDDTLIYERRDQPDWGFGGQVSDDGRFLIISIWQGTDPRNRIYYRDLTRPDAPVVKLLDDYDADYSFVDNDGGVFWFYTDLKAPRGRVIAIDTANPAPAQWKEVIPQAADTLKGVNLFGEKFLCTYLKDARSAVKLFSREGKPLGEVALPGLGSAGGFGGKRSDTETFYSFTSFTTPGAIYRYDLSTGTSSVFRAPTVDFKSTDFVTIQVFYLSKDGTRVPMFITHKKGLKPDGSNPTYLYGYGGFNISQTPGFSVSMAVWLELGGVYAVANLRGGGEYGEEWHQSGTKLKKQNVFNDFIGAAEWLCGRTAYVPTSQGNPKTGPISARVHAYAPVRYTRPDKLAIAGGSNGGLLVGACMTQRPELFGACLPAVGVMDMLRFHKFTIGWAWTSDYGSADNKDEFPALHAYSPYHNLKPGVRYPATLVTTADHDDRVVPAHSFKFAARLQETQSRIGPPVLIRIETKAGHGAGKPTAKLIEEAADKLGFIVQELGVSVAK